MLIRSVRIWPLCGWYWSQRNSLYLSYCNTVILWTQQSETAIWFILHNRLFKKIDLHDLTMFQSLKICIINCPIAYKFDSAVVELLWNSWVESGIFISDTRGFGILPDYIIRRFIQHWNDSLLVISIFTRGLYSLFVSLLSHLLYLHLQYQPYVGLCQAATRVQSHQRQSTSAVAIATCEVQVSAADDQTVPTVAIGVSKPLCCRLTQTFTLTSENLSLYNTILL